MNRLLSGFIILAVLGCESGTPDETDTSEMVATADSIHNDVLTIDTHIDIPFTFATEEVDPGVRGEYQVDLPKLEEGGLDAGFWIVYVGQTERTKENYARAKEDAMTKFDAIHRMTDEMYPDQIALAHSADDVETIHAEGKKVALIGIENGYVIGKDLTLLEKYHEMGARYVTLAHGGHNDIADSSTPRDHLGDGEEEHGGISDFGEDVIQEMNRLGIMVDVSHISKKAMLEAASLSRAPVIASHSSARALCDHPRNMDDEMLQALKENGGVVQTVAFSSYVKAAPDEKSEAIDSLRAAAGLTSRDAWNNLTDEQRSAYETQVEQLDEKWPPATVSDFVDHIDYMVDLIGIDHVGISSDFDGGGGIVGWTDASETPNVTRELVRRGYSRDEIAQIWGGNLLRVMREGEQVAAEMQADAS